MTILRRMGMVLDWFGISRAVPVSLRKHKHFHTADGAGNPGHPLATDSTGALIVAKLVHRNSGDTSVARSAHISFETSGGTEQCRVAGFRPAGTTNMAMVFHTGALSEKARIARTGELGIGGANKARAGSALNISMSTADCEFIEAGTAGATEAGWIKVEIGGSVMYLRAYATK